MPTINISCLVEKDKTRWGELLDLIPIVGADNLLADIAKLGVTHFCVGIGAIGDNQHRKQAFQAGLECGLKALTIKHQSAILSASSKLSTGAQILAGAIINSATSIGQNVIVNTGSIIEHDCEIGDHSHISSGAILCGSVTIGEFAHIGAGATIRQGIKIGRASIVGAGAVVVKDVADGATVVGVPARELKKN
jgi:UDP-perosamine 4-acetyltransferase